ncbi:hypothetical protein [Trichoplusia ni ascovirus 2c]|uniref:hypothetical protein n=1 Tax=Trichoplusia ni ascovirus 2c TaxID=328615 RepID=UPI0000E44239|nr:hypothetical protein TNAV2c_gp097 [Trichoplusia ni ascovirus 2c]ABF70614.1 hypothetical protein [Trichoplusia ni ascovirus 2c]AUS94203.1 hypothetical protein [Trichoplusia ni ascovirus 6b]
MNRTLLLFDTIHEYLGRVDSLVLNGNQLQNDIEVALCRVRQLKSEVTKEGIHGDTNLVQKLILPHARGEFINKDACSNHIITVGASDRS